ncbi:hypothetical protein ccbrp13_56290 [Ktedonobacteria bacterium brp13]|nr:hypothetical protein ccbrp13_56290 [Ktedonobacteria bacterium brp13]
MKSLTPTELAIIKFVEFVLFLALSAAVTVAFPLVNNATGTIDWTHVALSAAAIFLLVVVFASIEYLKQSIQVRLIAAEKTGQPTTQLQDQLAVVTAIEASVGLITENAKSIATLVPNIANLVSTAQQTAISALQQQQPQAAASTPLAEASVAFPPIPMQPQSAQSAPTVTPAPVSTYAYSVDQVSSTTGTVPAVTTTTTTP